MNPHAKETNNVLNLTSAATAELRATAEQIEDDWDDPVPLHSTPQLPTFPTEVLPGWLRGFVCDTAEELQVPVDMCAMLAIGVVSGAMVGRASISRGNWVEPANVFIAVAMEPGERKSAVFRAFMQALYRLEELLADLYGDANRERANRREVLEQTLARAKRDASGSTAGSQAMTKVNDIAREIEALPKPHPVHFIASNATTEALTLLMSQNGGAAVVASAEGADVVQLMAGKYSKNGDSDIELYLQAHAGDQIRVDRIGRARLVIDRPALTLIVTIQPSVIASIAAAEGAGERGLFARFVFVMPRTLMGTRSVNPRPVSQVVRDTFIRNVLAIGRVLRAPDSQPAQLHLSEDAVVALDAWRATLEPKRKGGGEHHAMRAVSSKLEGLCLRCVIALHVADQFESAGDWGPHGRLNEVVSPETVTRGIRIAEYAFAHAVAARGITRAKPKPHGIEAVGDWVSERNEFTRRDLQRGCKRFCDTKERANEMLDALIEHAWVRPALRPSRASGGRPPELFEVNPSVRWKGEP